MGYECPATKIFEEGYNCDGNTDLPQNAPSIPHQGFTGSSRPSAHDLNLDLSGDGSSVFFTSVNALTPQALADEQVGEVNHAPVYAENVYEYRGGNVYLISDGRDTHTMEDRSTTILQGTDPSGEDAFFETADQLAPQDTDTEVDLYDARVEGGSPPSTAAAGCSAGACQASSVAPSLLQAGSALTSGGGNLLPSLESRAKPEPLTRAERLSRALKTCRRKHGKPRHRCVSLADKRYGRGK